MNKKIENTEASAKMFLLVHAGYVLERRIEQVLEEAGLSNYKFAVLSALVSAEEPIGLSELALTLFCARSNITQLLDSLESDGLVCRIAIPNNRRSKKAELTQLGKLRFIDGAKAIDAFLKSFPVDWNSLSSETMQELIDSAKST